MRRLVLAFLLIPFLGAAFAAAQTTPALSAFHTVASSWVAPSGADCSASVTTNCIDGYTLTITPPSGGGSPTVIASCATAASGSACLGPGSVSYNFTPGGALYCGTWSVSLVANWLDNSGAAQTSTAITATGVAACPFVASPPTGLGIKFQ